jgi:hypothetical protein
VSAIRQAIGRYCMCPAQRKSQTFFDVKVTTFLVNLSEKEKGDMDDYRS